MITEGTNAGFWSILYQELKTWQTGIGALLGFLALMAAVLWSFHLNRRRDRDLRRAETISVATALYGEILLLRRELALLARVVASFEEHERDFSEIRRDIYRPSDPFLYSALADRLGLLEADLVLGITQFYAHLEDAKRGLDDLTSKQIGPQFGCTIVLRPAISAVYDIRATLRRIEALSGLPAAEDPNTGLAQAIIELEDERLREPIQ